MNREHRNVVAVFRIQMFKISEAFILEQVNCLSKFETVFLGRSGFGPEPEGSKALSIDGTAIHRAFASVWNAVTRDPRCFLRLLQGNMPSLIHAHFGPDAVYALPLARRLGAPLITTFHGFDVALSDWTFLKSRSPYLINYVLFRRQLASRGTLFLCVSQHIRRQALSMGFPEDKTRVHYIGVNTELMKPDPSQITPGKLLHVARLVTKKGTEYLLRAFKKVNQSYPLARLTIIGDGDLRHSLQQLTSALGLDKSVEFLGAQPNTTVREHLATSAIFVLPSVTAASGDTEGLPISILEAAAFGIPVIATHHGGIPEAVIDGETGLLVQERDVDALAAAIDRLLSSEPERRLFGAAARALVERKFNIRTQTALLEQYYLDLLN